MAAGDADFSEIAEAARLPVLVDLWAPWCGPCRTVSPIVEQLATEFAGQLKVVKVNVDTAPRIAARFQASSIPTLLIVEHGREVARQVGALPARQLAAWVRSQLNREAGGTG